MSRAIVLLLLTAVVAAADPPAAVRVDPFPGPWLSTELAPGGRRLVLSLGGQLRATAAYRRGLAGRSGGADRDEGLFDPRLTLELKAALDDPKLTAFARLSHLQPPEARPIGASGDDRLASRPERILRPRLEQAWLQAEDLPIERLLVRGGLLDLRYGLRPSGESFFLHLAGADSPFDRAVLGGGLGGRVTYRFEPLNQDLYLDAFGLRLTASDLEDTGETLLGLNADLMLAGPTKGRRNLVNLIAAGIARDGRALLTVGGGVDYAYSPYWAFHVEAYGQWGRRTGPLGQRQRLSAWAGRLGVRHTWFDRVSEPYVELGASYLSGGSRPGATSSREFTSYEDVDTFRIVEDDDLGLDLQSGYASLRARAGIDLSPALERDVRLELRYAYFEGVGRTRRIGHEVDLELRWKVDPRLEVGGWAAILLDSAHLAASRRGASSTALLVGLELALRF